MKQSLSFILIPLTALSFVFSIATPVQAQTNSVDFCYTFTRNLGEGRYLSVQDAQALAQALISAGVWNAGTTLTTYDDAVASAVSGFQEKYAAQTLAPNGLSFGTGYVGASTRAELNSLYGCSSASTTGTAAQNSQVCPIGWTCSPPYSTPVAFSCPAGWSCAPTVLSSTTYSSPSIPVSATNDSATLSPDAATPVASAVPVSNITAGTYLNLPVLTFDVTAQGANAHLHNVTVNLTNVGPGSIMNAYLYQGSTLVASTQISNNSTNIATFNNIQDGTQGAAIPANTTVPFSVTVDVSGLANISNDVSVPVSVTAGISSSGLVLYDTSDETVAINGSANGNTITVESAGVRFSLPNVPTIVKQVSNVNAFGSSTATYTATFNVQATTVDTSATLGLPNSSSPAITGDYSLVSVLENTTNINGPSASLSSFNNATISYSQPANTTLLNNGTSFVISPNQVVMMPVTVSFTVNEPNDNAYSVAVKAINWASSVGGQVQHSALYAPNVNNTLMTASI